MSANKSAHQGRSPARKAERQLILERTNWKNRRPDGADTGPIKRGMGVAQAVWYRSSGRGSQCEVRIIHDGSVELLSSVQDIGGGIRTALAQIVAIIKDNAALGLPG